MKDRKEDSKKEIRKVVIRKIVRRIFIGDVIFWIFIFVNILISEKTHERPFNNGNYMPFILYIICGTLLLDWMVGKLLKITYTEREEWKINEKFVDDVLSTDTYIQVLPNYNYVSPKYYYFFKQELPKLAVKYFAILDKENQKVEVFLKFKNNDEYYSLERLDKKDFPKSYKLKENCEDT